MRTAAQVSRAANLADLALRLFGDESGVELELPPRQRECEAPSFA
jgi:hypothetical protein